MTDQQPQKIEWDKIWSQKGLLNSAVNLGRNFYNSFFLKLLLKHARPGTEMVELGCGTATLSTRLAPKIKSYTGIDYSKEAVALAKMSLSLASQNASNSHFDNIKILQYDALNLPPELIGKFDLVWSQGLAEHFASLESIVKAHWFLAKQGGTILISVPYKHSYHFLWYWLTRPSFLKKLWPWEDVDTKFLTRKELLSVGRSFSPSAQTVFLPPSIIGFPLGLIILKIKK